MTFRVYMKRAMIDVDDDQLPSRLFVPKYIEGFTKILERSLKEKAGRITAA